MTTTTTTITTTITPTEAGEEAFARLQPLSVKR